MGRRIMDEPVETIVDPEAFYAWNNRRTVQRKIEGVEKIQDYTIDTNRWATDFRRNLTPPSSPPGPVRTQRRRAKRAAPYSPSDSDNTTPSPSPSPQRAAAAGAMDSDDRDRAIVDEVLGKTRAVNNLRRNGKCIHCGEKDNKRTGSTCGDACIAAWIEEHKKWENTHLELRQGPLGYGVFVRPGCGGIPAHTHLAVYAGELIPFNAHLSLVNEQASRYLFELHDVAKKEENKRQLIVDAKDAGNWTRFVNSHCKPNCMPLAMPLGKRTYIIFKANRRALKEGEELTICYGESYFKDAPTFTPCLCDAIEGQGPHYPPKNA